MIFIVIIGLCVFAYLACNIGADRRIGHNSHGMAPALYVLIACALGLLLWSFIGSFAIALLGPILAHVK